MQNRPTGRKTNVTGQAKNTTTHGQASGQRPVGNQGGYQGRDMNGPSGPRPQANRPQGSTQRPSSSGNGSQMNRGGGGKIGIIAILLLLLLGGGGGLGGLFGGGGDTSQTTLPTEAPEHRRSPQSE